jgi:DNA-binding phage protein
VRVGGGIQRGSQRDIDWAKELHAEYKARKKICCQDIRQTQEVKQMALTRDFKITVMERVERDPAFAHALPDEAATLFLNGEAETARPILRDLVNATLGFEQLAQVTDKPSTSLHRMLSSKGNPSMDNLVAIFGAVRQRLGVYLEVRTVQAPA